MSGREVGGWFKIAAAIVTKDLMRENEHIAETVACLVSVLGSSRVPVDFYKYLSFDLVYSPFSKEKDLISNQVTIKGRVNILSRKVGNTYILIE